MVIRGRAENASFLESHLLGQLEIALYRPDPSRNFRVFIASLKAFSDCFLILFIIQEKLTLANKTLFAPELVNQVVEVYYLFDCVRRTGLLSIPEGCVRDPYLIWHVHRVEPIIEWYFWYFIVREDIPKKIGFCRILQLEDVLFRF